jgi:HEAT repeat protein
MYIETIKKVIGIKLELCFLMANTLVNYQVFAYEYEMEYSPEVTKEVSKARTQQEKINIAKNYLAGTDYNKQMQAIYILRPLGGEAIPVLLNQLKTELELQNKELNAITKKTRYSLINSIIFSLGFTRDKKIIDPLINVIKANDLPGSVRCRAIEVLGIIGPLVTPAISTFKKQAKPAEGYEIKESDSEKIKNVLIEMLNDAEPSVRINAIDSLRNYNNRDVIPIFESMAREDKYKEEIDASLRGGEKGEIITIYPVREAAENALKQLNKQKKWDEEMAGAVSITNKPGQ